MVSTHSRAGVNKQVEAGPSCPANITSDLVTILDGQAKMQQELADLKKHSADEMEALRQENSRIRRKIEADPTQKGKAKETSEAAGSPAFQPTEEESEHNPTPHTFTTTQQTPILSAHPTHFHPTLLGHTAAPTLTATLPTTHVPPYNMPTTLHTTHIPPYNPHNLPTTHIPPHNFTSTFPTLVHHPIPPYPLPSHQPRRRHPFTDFIANTPLPTQWGRFTLERYIGKTDPDEHLKVYITHVALYTSHDPVFCKAFPTTLKGPVLEWFTTLPPYSIDNFDTLSHMFTTYFTGSRPHQTTTISLLSVRQEQGETFRAFIDRFTKVALRTPHLNQEMILQCMALTLQPGPFANNVYLHPPTSMHDLKLRVVDYVCMEEMQTLHTKFCNDYAPSTANPTPQPPRPDPRPREPRQPRFTRYAPLNVPKSRILDEALQADLIPPLRKMTTPPNADMTKYCRYHRNHGHTTKDCKALQDKIEELVRAGHVRRFVHREDHSSRSHPPPHPDHRRPLRDSHHDKRPNQHANHNPQSARTDITPTDSPLRGTINTISGGFASEGSTSSARKRYLRHIQSINHITHSHHRHRMPPITFTDDDFHGLDHQQDDPMVITVEIENYAVKKVLLDQGSSVDILYWATYQKLQLPDTAMVPYDEPIYGFSGEKVSTRGYIDFHTVFRDGAQTKTVPIRFLIADTPTSYNVLLGRPSLNTFCTVVSTPHLAMKFPSPSSDILTIHGDQCLACECYMASLRPQLPILQTNHIERPPGFEITLSGDDLDPRVGQDVRLEPVEETTPLKLPNGRTIKLGTGLESEQRDIITPTIVDNSDLFVWSAADLPGVDPQVASHKLSIYKEARYISQKNANFARSDA
ncbi:uncharacterized protein LOC114194807 [Vigna unguiculata]|uniref:uncharacterized protein LOC114194807 n=1 Tax=Vigna unguiculata TaxID=3917 RepID=UPI001016B3F2|nr:uncharacterized protein LOC114194807 [Vigna unguiculata]